MRNISMLAILTFALTRAATPLPPGAGAQQPIGTAQPGESGAIQGLVTQSGTSDGIASAQITITVQTTAVIPPRGAGQPAVRQATAPLRTLTTDSSGRFESKDLRPGTYVVTVQSDGYFGAVSRGIASASVSASAVVTPGKTANVTLSMSHGATINGRVTDSNGVPLADLTIAAFEIAYQEIEGGRPILQPVVSKQSSDRGEFRLFWLTPGEYIVGIASQQGARGARGNGVRGTAPGSALPLSSYYPGVLDAYSAVRVHVDEGRDVSGIDFTVQAGSTGVTISGRVDNKLPNPQIGPFGTPGLFSSRFFLSPLAPASLNEANPIGILNAGVGRGGSDFKISGVHQGSYDLIALVPDDQGQQFFGRTHIDVGSQDLSGIAISVRPGVEIKGHITVSGNGATVPLDRNIVQALRPIDGSPAALASAIVNPARPGFGRRGAPGASPPADPLLFSFSNVPDGRYQFQIAVPAPAYVEDIREGGRSIFDSGLVVADGTPHEEIQVTVNSDGETVRGTVEDANGKPVPGAQVVLLPPPAQRQNFYRYKTTIASTTGQFTLIGVPPGEYMLFAWEDVPMFAWMNAQFMTQYEVSGGPVSVAHGIRADARIRVIPAGK